MIMGIISFILLIIGTLLMCYEFNADINDISVFLIALACILISIGILGVVTFGCVNIDTIRSWFII